MLFVKRCWSPLVVPVVLASWAWCSQHGASLDFLTCSGWKRSSTITTTNNVPFFSPLSGLLKESQRQALGKCSNVSLEYPKTSLRVSRRKTCRSPRLVFVFSIGPKKGHSYMWEEVINVFLFPFLAPCRLIWTVFMHLTGPQCWPCWQKCMGRKPPGCIL